MHVRGLIMSEISNAFEHFIILLMKSDSHFLNKSDSSISTNSTCMYILSIVPIKNISSFNSTHGNLTPK